MEYATGTSRSAADGEDAPREAVLKKAGVWGERGTPALKSQTPVLGSDSSSVPLSLGARFLIEKHEDNDSDLTESV